MRHKGIVALLFLLTLLVIPCALGAFVSPVTYYLDRQMNATDINNDVGLWHFGDGTDTLQGGQNVTSTKDVSDYGNNVNDMSGSTNGNAIVPGRFGNGIYSNASRVHRAYGSANSADFKSVNGSTFVGWWSIPDYSSDGDPQGISVVVGANVAEATTKRFHIQTYQASDTTSLTFRLTAANITCDFVDDAFFAGDVKTFNYYGFLFNASNEHIYAYQNSTLVKDVDLAAEDGVYCTLGDGGTSLLNSLGVLGNTGFIVWGSAVTDYVTFPGTINLNTDLALDEGIFLRDIANGEFQIQEIGPNASPSFTQDPGNATTTQYVNVSFTANFTSTNNVSVTSNDTRLTAVVNNATKTIAVTFNANQTGVRVIRMNISNQDGSDTTDMTFTVNAAASQVVIPNATINSLDYWNQDDNASKLWINVSIRSGDTLNIKIYNVTQFLSSGSKVFPLFDDFNDGNINTSLWKNSSYMELGGACAFVETGGTLTVQATSSSDADSICVLSSVPEFSVGYAMESRTNIGSFAGGGATERRWFGWGNLTVSGQVFPTDYLAFFQSDATQSFVRLKSGESTLTSSITFTNDLMRYFLIGRLTNESWWLENRNTATKGANTFATNISTASMGPTFVDGTLAGNGQAKNISSDWAFVRPVVYSEPTLVTYNSGSYLEVNITNIAGSDLHHYPVLIDLPVNNYAGNLTIEQAPAWDEASASGNFTVPANLTITLNWTSGYNATAFVNDSRASVITNNVTQSAAVTFNLNESRSYVVAYTINNSNGSDSFTVLYTALIAPTWDQQPPNVSLLHYQNYTAFYNWTATNAANVLVNDSHVIGFSDNNTQTYNFTFNANESGLFYVLFNVTNANGYDDQYVRFNVTQQPIWDEQGANTSYGTPFNYTFTFNYTSQYALSSVNVNDSAFTLAFTNATQSINVTYNAPITKTTYAVFTISNADGSASMYLLFNATNSAPSAPGAFTAPACGSQQDGNYLVDWGDATDANGQTLTYVIEYSFNSGGTWAVFGNTTSTSRIFTAQELGDSSDHTRFRVRAFDGIDFGSYTDMGCDFVLISGLAGTGTGTSGGGGGGLITQSFLQNQSLQGGGYTFARFNINEDTPLEVEVLKLTTTLRQLRSQGARISNITSNGNFIALFKTQNIRSDSEKKGNVVNFTIYTFQLDFAKDPQYITADLIFDDGRIKQPSVPLRHLGNGVYYIDLPTQDLDYGSYKIRVQASTGNEASMAEYPLRLVQNSITANLINTANGDWKTLGLWAFGILSAFFLSVYLVYTFSKS